MVEWIDFSERTFSGVIAIKGIGGYLFTCYAGNIKAIQLKHRPTKPFALMFLNLESVEKEVDISKIESKELTSVVALIVILNFKNTTDTNLQLEVIAPNQNQIGVMLPYTPLFDLILEKFKKSIVATSRKISNTPILSEDKKTMKELSAMLILL